MQDHLLRMVQENKLRPEDADLILKSLQDLLIRSNLSDISLKVRARYLSQFCRYLPKPVIDCDISEIQYALAEYRRSHAQNTFRQMIIYVTAFLKFHKISGYKEVYTMIPERKWLTKRAGDMLTNEEVESLIAAARNSRDRAMISILYEGGLRPIELVRLTWRHVKLDKDGAVLSIESSVNKKTGKPRYVRLINSGALLAAWKYDHPIDKLNGPVFVKRRAPYAPITTTTIRHVIEDAVSRSGITKHVHPYLFRHTRVTHMLEEEVPDNIIKLQHWGSLNTPMLATYGHISNEAVDRILLERAGIKRAPEKRKKAALHPIQCPDCEFVNPPGARFCMDCAYPFTEEGKDLKRALDQARHDPQVLRDFADWLEQKNNKEQRI